MREIKFRAWDGKRMGNVVEMDFAGNAPNHKIVFARSFDTEMLFPHDIVGVLMQYTGLKDKHGKEIYEGDIVEFPVVGGDLVRHEVIFNRGAFATKSGRMWGFEPKTGYLGFYEVIGNIYEYPKLLKV